MTEYESIKVDLEDAILKQVIDTILFELLVDLADEKQYWTRQELIEKALALDVEPWPDA